MRVKKISAFVMACVLCLSPFTLFSFAADGGELKDSGSPEVSMMAMRAIAADEGISLAAAEGNSGQFGYNIEPYPISNPTLYRFSESWRYDIGYDFGLLPSGTYSITMNYNADFSLLRFRDTTNAITLFDLNDTLSSGTGYFTLSSPARISVYGRFSPSDFSSIDDISILSYSVSLLQPVEGISSGYTYSSGVIPNTTRSIFETLTPSFGNQPAGKYLINIYHWGDSYDVKFHISDSSENYYLPTSTNGGVTTLVYNHPGGDFILDGSFTASNDETSVVDGNFSGAGMGEYFQLLGGMQANGPLSWVFNITDIVAIPYEQAADSNFGFFAPIIGFFRDQFSDMKSWIAIQIDKIAGDDETKSDVDDAQSELQKEVEDLNNLSGQLDTQASNLEQQFTTDFAIPDTVSGQGSNFQSIYTSLFGSLGVFGIFIWLPIVMAVIKKLLRL